MAASRRPIHFKHTILCNLDVIASAARTKNWIGKCGLINAVFDERLVDVDRNHFAKDQPSLHWFACMGLELNYIGDLAFHRGVTFRNARNAHEAAWYFC
jgi:hypothetical protein